MQEEAKEDQELVVLMLQFTFQTSAAIFKEGLVIDTCVCAFVYV